MRYPDGGGLDAAERGPRGRVRLGAAETSQAGAGARGGAERLRGGRGGGGGSLLWVEKGVGSGGGAAEGTLRGPPWRDSRREGDGRPGRAGVAGRADRGPAWLPPGADLPHAPRPPRR